MIRALPTKKDGNGAERFYHRSGEPGSVNHLPIAESWNYMVRFYQPRKEILDGTWTFPEVKPWAEK